MTPNKIPTWLKNHLIDSGNWTEGGVSRKAKLRTHQCGQPVLHGLDHDNCAWTATVNTQPLTPLGELLAHTAGLATYEYRIRVEELDHRDKFSMAGNPAGSDPNIHVLAEHICHAAELPHYQPAAPTTKETPDVCPF